MLNNTSIENCEMTNQSIRYPQRTAKCQSSGRQLMGGPRNIQRVAPWLRRDTRTKHNRLKTLSLLPLIGYREQFALTCMLKAGGIPGQKPMFLGAISENEMAKTLVNDKHQGQHSHLLKCFLHLGSVFPLYLYKMKTPRLL